MVYPYFCNFEKNNSTMGLRIKEICKIKGLKMVDIAEKLGISPVNLSASLNGNPTLSRLTEVAQILSVDVTELFEQPMPSAPSINGFVEVNGTIHKIMTTLKMHK